MKKERTVRYRSIRSRLHILIVIVMVPLFAIALYATVSLSRVYRNYDQTVQNITTVNSYNVVFEETMNSDMYYIIVESYNWDTLKNEEDSKNPYYLIEDMRTHFEQLRRDNTDPEITNDIDSILRVLGNLKKRVDTIISNVEEGGHYDENMTILKNDINVMTELIQGDIDNYIYLTADIMESTREKLSSEVRFTLAFLVILLAASLTFGLVSSRRISHRITDPIARLCDAADRFAAGDFSARVEVHSGDEIEILANSFNDMGAEIARLIENTRIEEKNTRELELRLLQQQIKPHFLYNTLDAIMWLTEAGENEQAVSMVSSLSNFFRTGLSRGHDWIKVSEEESHERSYLEIQQFRYRDILSYQIEIAEDIKDYYIMKLMLQPIVENALYHGIKNRRAMGHILVKGEKRQGKLLFTVQDDGIGMKPDELDYMRKLISGEAESVSGSGFGIANVEQRIHLGYGEPYGVRVESTYGVGTTVTVCVPALSKPGRAKDAEDEAVLPTGEGTKPAANPGTII